MDTFDVDIAIIGSGFSGLGMAIRLKQEGIEDFVVLERGDDVGGTWRDNTYPGCACDVPSHLYSFSFAPNPRWTRDLLAASPRSATTCGASPTSTASARTCGSNTSVSGVDVGRAAGAGRVETSDGPLTRARRRRRHRAAGRARRRDARRASTTSRARRSTPPRWDHDYDLAGKRVAVVGTGASAIQFVPADPAATSSSCTSSSARRRGSCRTRTGRSRRASARLYRALPGAPEARARRHLLRRASCCVLGFVEAPAS